MPAYKTYLGRQDTYGKQGAGREIKKPIAYFSAEFGFHESIPNYSGGLGILSGDHCKSASDLDLNFIAVGLLYRHGYFKQQINKEGWQEAINLNQNYHHLPIREMMRNDQILLVSVSLLGREVFAKIWELRVAGSICICSTPISREPSEDRLITAELYGGDLKCGCARKSSSGSAG